MAIGKDIRPKMCQTRVLGNIAVYLCINDNLSTHTMTIDHSVGRYFSWIYYHAQYHLLYVVYIPLGDGP